MAAKRARKTYGSAGKKKVKKALLRGRAGVVDESKEAILTPEGVRQIEGELEHLRTVVRKEAIERVREAMQFGEPMENAELERVKSEQAAIESRIQELQRLLKNARVVESVAADGCVHVGTTVKVKDAAGGEEFEYRIVGAMEADPASQRISNQSPVGQALLGHKAGDKVTVSTPTGSTELIILSVE
jgi:transcription elongation factor GreA